MQSYALASALLTIGAYESMYRKDALHIDGLIGGGDLFMLLHFSVDENDSGNISSWSGWFFLFVIEHILAASSLAPAGADRHHQDVLLAVPSHSL